MLTLVNVTLNLFKWWFITHLCVLLVSMMTVTMWEHDRWNHSFDEDKTRFLTIIIQTELKSYREILRMLSSHERPTYTLVVWRCCAPKITESSRTLTCVFRGRGFILERKRATLVGIGVLPWRKHGFYFERKAETLGVAADVPHDVP